MWGPRFLTETYEKPGPWVKISASRRDGAGMGGPRWQAMAIYPPHSAAVLRRPVIRASLTVFLIQKHTPVNWTLYVAIAFATSITVGYLVSVITGGSRKDLTGLTVWDLRRTES